MKPREFKHDSEVNKNSGVNQIVRGKCDKFEQYQHSQIEQDNKQQGLPCRSLLALITTATYLSNISSNHERFHFHLNSGLIYEDKNP